MNPRHKAVEDAVARLSPKDRNKLLARLADSFDELRDWFDKAADAAFLEPGCPQMPECIEDRIPSQREPEKPRDIMGGA